MTRLLGLDYGTRRIGVAVSDPLGISAQPLVIIEREDDASDLKRIQDIAAEKEAQKLIIGLPLNMDGSEGTSAAKVRKFAAQLEEAIGLPVEFFDERLTSVQTERMLVEEADMSRHKRKGVRDKIAASMMLQAYLDSHA